MPYRAPPSGPTVNLFAAELIGQTYETDSRRVARLVLALHRGVEIPHCVARSTMPALLDWADDWMDGEMVAGRDTTAGELRAAWQRLQPVQADLEPASVFPPPSVDS